jgi:chemotaxis protein CheZ
MQAQISRLISLDQAQQLVKLLEAGDQESADNVIKELATPLQRELFEEVGKLTRQLHSALMDFQVDNRLVELANTEIPDAKERLNYVIDITEQAANKTMDAVEECIPLADSIIINIHSVSPMWEKLMRRDIALGDFKALCHDVQSFMSHSQHDSNRLRELLNEILMAQDFQDLTGQMIRRVIDLVREVEHNLVSMLTVFGDNAIESFPVVKDNKIEAEGPIMNAELREDVVTGQDEVDDLLSSLGF